MDRLGQLGPLVLTGLGVEATSARRPREELAVSLPYLYYFYEAYVQGTLGTSGAALRTRDVVETVLLVQNGDGKLSWAEKFVPAQGRSSVILLQF